MCVLQVSVIFWPFSGVIIPYLTPRPPLVLGKVCEGCPVSIRPFWISREPVAWPGCTLAASHKRPYCASLNRHSPVGLVSRQWDAVDWPCVLCDRRIHNDRASRSASSQGACPFYSSRAGFFLANYHVTQVSQPPTAQICPPSTSGFSQS